MCGGWRLGGGTLRSSSAAGLLCSTTSTYDTGHRCMRGVSTEDFELLIKEAIEAVHWNLVGALVEVVLVVVLRLVRGWRVFPIIHLRR